MKKYYSNGLLLAAIISYTASVNALGSRPQAPDDEADASLLLQDQAQEAQPSIQEQTQYLWSDGKRQYKVYLEPDMLMEFKPSEEGDNALKSVFARATVMQSKGTQVKGGAVRLWDLREKLANGKRTQELQQKFPTGKFSEVFRDKPGSSGRLRTIPGNMIVQLDPGMSDTQVDDWIKANGLVLDRKMGFGKNILVIKSAPGLATLVKANELAKTNGVVSAYPDWWQQMGLK